MTHEKYTLARSARQLIAKEENWTQFAEARNSFGRPVSVDSKTATCWCASGAVWNRRYHEKYSYDIGLKVLRELSALASADGYLVIEWFNDSKSHADVLALFDTYLQGATNE